MNWFFIALIAPLLWSITNHVDKFLLSRFLKSGSVGALIIFSSLIALIVIPIMYLINPAVLNITTNNALILVVGGIVSAFAILFYLYAMSEEETSVVVPFFQLIPLFLYIFGFILLGESLSKIQIFAGLLIVLGAILLSVEIGESQGHRLKKKLIFFMMLSSALYALYETMFKFVAIKEDFWVSNFWQYIGLLLFGIFILIFIGKYRREFLKMVRENGTRIFGLNALNEIIVILGNLALAFASLLAPIALVGLVNAYQPLFVFVIGIGLTIFWPKIASEKIRGRYLIQKIIAILVIFIGSCLLQI